MAQIGRMLILLAVTVGLCEGLGHKRVCYFSSWARYRPQGAAFKVANVDPFLCTHLIYAFADFDYRGTIKLQQDTDDELHTYKEFNDLKRVNPELKTLVSVGGWNFGSKKFSQMAAHPTTRSNFVASAVRFLRQYGFDGLDLDWEYPTLRGGAAKDRDNLVLLVKELKQAFEAEASGNKQLLLTAAVSAGRHIMDVSYNVQAMDRYLDLWHLMTYDYHGAWEGKTGHNSPLHPSATRTEAGLIHNVEWTATEYVRRGASKHKIMIGLPMYGHSYRLQNPSHSAPLSPASLGPAGPFTGQAGFWAYYEVCQRIADSGFRKVITDATQRVPYYVERNLWISFDDVDSIKEKARWLKLNGFGGFMIWSLDLDVFNTSLCTATSSPYPLLTAATSVLLDTTESEKLAEAASAQGGAISPLRPVTQAPLRTSTWSSWIRTTRAPYVAITRAPVVIIRDPPSTSTTDSGTEFICGNRPYRGYSDPSSPCKYIVCWAGVAYHRTCNTGTVFDPSIGVCTWPKGDADVNC